MVRRPSSVNSSERKNLIETHWFTFAIKLQKPVLDCDWSAVCSTTFGLVTKDGPQIWDLKANMLHPIISLPSLDQGYFAAIAFAVTNNVSSKFD